MVMPNFFIIGAQKAGTTSLYHYLNQHPQIYMSPIKEPFFFDHEISPNGEVVQQEFGGRQQAPRFVNIEQYCTLFRAAKGETAIGEASPLYIYAPGTPERIKKYVPEARSIALLRNPADRAYSAFLHAVRIGAEPLTDFAQALQREEDRIRDNWHYVFHYRTRGLYHAQLKRYYEVFGRERVGVWLYEDLRDDPASVTQDVFRFLEVDDTFVADTSSRHNPAGVPESEAARAMMRMTDTSVGVLRNAVPPTSKIFPFVSKMRRAVQSRVLTEPPPIDPEIRTELIKGYREDILKLQVLIGRDLSMWLR
jgi:sulfotransferase family protein